MAKKIKGASEQIVLKGALSGIKKELAKLKVQKSKLEKALGSTSSTLKMTRAEEIEFRTRLNELENIEAKLSDDKENLDTKFQKIKERAEKIKKIEEELEEI